MNANSLLASPTGLSPYLRFGCLSCRLFYYRLWDLYKKVRCGEQARSPPGTALVASHPRRGPFSLALGLGCESSGDSSEKPEMGGFLEVTAGHN
jgi:hypothetical protein